MLCVKQGISHSAQNEPSHVLLPPVNEVSGGYVFTPVSHSVRGGSVSVHAGIPPLGADTPPPVAAPLGPGIPGSIHHPREQSPPLEDQTPPEHTPPPWEDQTPLGADLSGGPGNPPPPEQTPPQCMLGDTVNKWAVCILLECNLVYETSHLV